MSAISWGVGNKSGTPDVMASLGQSTSANIARSPALPRIVDPRIERLELPISAKPAFTSLEVDDAVHEPTRLDIIPRPLAHIVAQIAGDPCLILGDKNLFIERGERKYLLQLETEADAITSSITRSFFELVPDVRSNRPPTPAERMQRRLQGLREEAMGEHPDPESHYPTPQAFTDAWEFASRLDLNSYDFPMVNMAGDGEINFFWRRESDGLKVDLGFYGTGTYSCYARKGYREVFADDVRVADGLRDDIAALLPEE